jgi:hypothetical protein
MSSLVPIEAGGYVFDNVPKLTVHLIADETAAACTHATVRSTDGSGIEAEFTVRRGENKLVTWPLLGPARLLLDFDSVTGIRLGATVMKVTAGRASNAAVFP